MSYFKLFSTEHCHLCELAEAIIEQVIFNEKLIVEIVDISESDELFELYGTKIPVLMATKNKAELLWPFDASDVQQFIQNQ